MVREWTGRFNRFIHEVPCNPYKMEGNEPLEWIRVEEPAIISCNNTINLIRIVMDFLVTSSIFIWD